MMLRHKPQVQVCPVCGGPTTLGLMGDMYCPRCMDREVMEDEVLKGIMGTAEPVVLGEGDPTLGAWLLHLPTAHPAWDDYLLGVITLADVPGFAPSVKQSPDVTHEIALLALSPDYHPNAHDRETRVPLAPINFAMQFKATDEQAVEVVDQCASLLVDGKLIIEPREVRGGQDHWGAVVRKILIDFNDRQNGETT